MSALALYLKSEGNYVQGSDISNSKIAEKLIQQGIVVFNQHQKENINKGFEIVYSYAISNDNVELIEAKKLGLIIKSRAEILGEISKQFEQVIAVAGSHGKTTTTAMIYSCLKIAGKEPTLHIGGELIDNDFGLVIGDKKYFICEACEYCDSFLKLSPTIGVVLNIEPEHLDYFKTFNNEISSFNIFANQCTSLIAFDNELLKANNILTFGKHNSNISAKNIEFIDGKYEYDCFINQKFSMHIRVGAEGEYNIINSLAVIGVCKAINISNEYIQQGIQNYQGVKRRYEVISSCPYIVHDYAHHPTEIKNTIKTFLKHTNNKVVVVFQPHTYSRTKTLFDSFIQCFTGVNEVIFVKTYSAREKYDKSASSYFLYKTYKKTGKSCSYFANFNIGIKKIIKKIKDNYSILILGAGDIVDVAYKLKSVLKNNSK